MNLRNTVFKLLYGVKESGLVNAFLAVLIAAASFIHGKDQDHRGAETSFGHSTTVNAADTHFNHSYINSHSSPFPLYFTFSYPECRAV